MHNLKKEYAMQKDESQNGRFKKTKHVKFSEKQTVFSPWY